MVLKILKKINSGYALHKEMFNSINSVMQKYCLLSAFELTLQKF